MNHAVNHAKLNASGIPHLGDAGIALRDDAVLVRACLAQGGFPRAVKTSHGTVWAGPEGGLWKGVRAPVRKGRARS